MGQIYSKARTVLIWIGPGDHDSELALAITPGLIRDLEGLDATIEEDEVVAPRFQVLLGKGEIDASHADALNRLLKRRWFSRVWTLQEAALGHSCQLLCGDRQIDFDLLLLLNERSRTDSRGHWKAVVEEIGMANILGNVGQRWATQHLQTIAKLRQAWAQRASGNKEPLFMLLARLRTCDCTDDKDRIYGLYEFLPMSIQQSLERGLKPSEHTVKSLYMKVAATEIVERKQISFLSMAGFTEQDPTLELPSWIPDWTRVGRQRSFAFFNQDRINKGSEPVYHAGTYSHEPDPKIDGYTLHVQGKLIGSIVDIGAPFSLALPSKMDWPSYPEKYAEEARISSQRLDQVHAALALARRHEPLHTGTDTDIACYRSMFTTGKGTASGSTSDALLLASDSELRNYMESWTEHHDLTVKWSMEPSNEALSKRRVADSGASNIQEFKDYLARLGGIRDRAGIATEVFQDACKGRAFCIVEQTFPAGHGGTVEKERFAGLAPQNAQVGDVVTVIYGLPAPMLLRRLQNGSSDGNNRVDREGKYRLLSECYIHGFMDGEAMAMTELVEQDTALV